MAVVGQRSGDDVPTRRPSRMIAQAFWPKSGQKTGADSMRKLGTETPRDGAGTARGALFNRRIPRPAHCRTSTGAKHSLEPCGCAGNRIGEVRDPRPARAGRVIPAGSSPRRDPPLLGDALHRFIWQVEARQRLDSNVSLVPTCPIGGLQMLMETDECTKQDVVDVYRHLRLFHNLVVTQAD